MRNIFLFCFLNFVMITNVEAPFLETDIKIASTELLKKFDEYTAICEKQKAGNFFVKIIYWFVKKWKGFFLKREIKKTQNLIQQELDEIEKLKICEEQNFLIQQELSERKKIQNELNLSEKTIETLLKNKLDDSSYSSESITVHYERLFNIENNNSSSFELKKSQQNLPDLLTSYLKSKKSNINIMLIAFEKYLIQQEQKERAIILSDSFNFCFLQESERLHRMNIENSEAFLFVNLATLAACEFEWISEKETLYGEFIQEAGEFIQEAFDLQYNVFWDLFNKLFHAVTLQSYSNSQSDCQKIAQNIAFFKFQQNFSILYDRLESESKLNLNNMFTKAAQCGEKTTYFEGETQKVKFILNLNNDQKNLIKNMNDELDSENIIILLKKYSSDRDLSKQNLLCLLFFYRINEINPNFLPVLECADLYPDLTQLIAEAIF